MQKNEKKMEHTIFFLPSIFSLIYPYLHHTPSLMTFLSLQRLWLLKLHQCIVRSSVRKLFAQCMDNADRNMCGSRGNEG